MLFNMLIFNMLIFFLGVGPNTLERNCRIFLVAYKAVKLQGGNPKYFEFLPRHACPVRRGFYRVVTELQTQ